MDWFGVRLILIHMKMNQKQKIERAEVLTTAHHDHEKGMNTHAFFKVNSHTVGQDLVQDTFIKTWSYLVKGGKINLMRPFLYHILNQLIIDEYRRRKTLSLDTLIEEKGFEPSFNNSEKILNVLDGKTALLLIKYLPVKYEKVMRMRYEKEFSLEEISIITGQSKNAVAVQIHRGLARLKKIYNHT
jgi:RNA polymerase sigma-70 factor, ECF subfamily